MSGDGITNFYYNKDVFSRLKKDKRIGFHMGTIGNGIGERYILVKRFVTTDYISHPKMFLTININYLFYLFLCFYTISMNYWQLFLVLFLSSFY